MPFHLRPRLMVAAVALVALVGGGLADWASTSSPGYVVRAGDSLWVIAQTHGVTVAQLASANGIDPNAILPIGRRLQIPASSAGGSSGAQGGSPPVVTVATGGSYTPWSVCSALSVNPGPWGRLPSVLAASPSRLALRPIFEKWASHYGLSLPLLEAVDWQESGWQQGVVSSAGAVGVGQIEPGTAVFIQSVLVGEDLDINSVSDNIRMSAAFLAYLAHIEGNNRCATIAAYYEGPVNLSAYGVPPAVQQYVADVESLLPRFD